VSLADRWFHEREVDEHEFKQITLYQYALKCHPVDVVSQKSEQVDKNQIKNPTTCYNDITELHLRISHDNRGNVIEVR